MKSLVRILNRTGLPRALRARLRLQRGSWLPDALPGAGLLRWRQAIGGFALLALLSLNGCSERTVPATAGAAVAAAPTAASQYHERGRAIYNFRCYFCHGYSGDAETLASTYLTPRPRNFAAMTPDQMSREQMLDSITNGRAGTAMKGFAEILSAEDIATVADFLRQEFVIDKARNTSYHTAANGWPNHERYQAAFPFATGKILLDAPAEGLTPEQRAGRKLFMASCVSCHDRAKVADEGVNWDLRPLSYPRNGFQPGDWPPKLDGMSSATPYSLHDRVPKIPDLSKLERQGEQLYQMNCAFCHAGNGTSRNWIGSFLEPHPRDLTSPQFMAGMTSERLAHVIREGLPETSMPAWKSVLTNEEISAVIAYISRAFHPVQGVEKSAAGAAPR